MSAVVDSTLCLVNGTKKLVNVLTTAKDIGFDLPVTSAYFVLGLWDSAVYASSCIESSETKLLFVHEIVPS